MLEAVNHDLRDLCGRIESGGKLEISDRDLIMDEIRRTVKPYEVTEDADANN